MGTGPNKKLVLVSVCSISICYRGLDPPNRNVAKKEREKEERDMQSVGLIFPPGAAIGSCRGVVCPGLTRCRGINPVEEIVIY